MPIRICLVALNAWPAINSEISGPIGGMETRAWSLARGLARQPGLDVSFIIRHGQPLKQTTLDGVTLHLLRDRLYLQRESLALRLHKTSRFPWISLHHPQWSDVFSLSVVALQRLWTGKPDPYAPLPICKQIPADVFLTFGAQRISAQIIAAARARGHRSALFLAHDTDVDERILTDPDYVGPAGDSATVCRWILTHADMVLCQTPAQQQSLRKFGREGILFRNPIDLERWHSGPALSLPQTSGLSRYALWIGRADRNHKQPMLLIELARQCPQVPFLMVMNRRDETVEQEVRRTAPDNVRIVEQVPFTEMPEVMRGAAVLVNTSASEGFPNTFLQAAASGVPIASLHVEKEFLKASRTGWCAQGDLTALGNFVEKCREGCQQGFDPQFARNYLNDQHSLTTQVEELTPLLTALVH